MGANLDPESPAPRDGYVHVDGATLFWRDIGQGRPVVVLHDGPDFDHGYLLPEMDRLSDAFRLIYYDQRGRGKSAANVRPDDVTMASEIADLECVRTFFGLESVALLGHSWGGLLAMEYALRHPERVARLILMNTAPASRDDFALFRQSRRTHSPADIEEQIALSSTPQFKDGDPDTVAAYYRIHFQATLRNPERLDRIVERLRSSSTTAGILKARAIEDRLMNDTWLADAYDLLPKLTQRSIPTLIIHGEHDFIPVECSTHIAQAIPGARLVSLNGCGHFSYLECPDGVRAAMVDFVRSTR